MRAFLAVEIAPDVRARLVAVQRELAGHQAVRWVHEDNLHVTVKFLGNVSEATMEELRETLDAALLGTPVLDASVRGLGAFPSARRPRAVWAGVDCPSLTTVATASDAAAARLGVASEARAFRAHVTLGRVTETKNASALTRALTARADEAVGVCTFDALVAFRSDLRPGGALYTTLWSIPFGG